MQTKIEKLPNNTYKLEITVDKTLVNEAFEHSLKHFAENAEIQGFRKGHAPISMVEEKINKSDLNGDIINHLVPESYVSAIKEHHLSPIIGPKIEIIKFEKGNDFVFTALVIEKPSIEIADYAQSIKTLPQKSPKILGKDGTPIDKQDKGPTVDELVQKVLDVTKIEISEVLIRDEVDRMISGLIDQTSKMGITVDDYLRSVNKTVETLRTEYSKIADFNLKTEFVLSEIASREKIGVSDEEIEKAIQAAPDEESRRILSQADQKWYIKSVLLKNKVIQYLISLAYGENKNEPNSK